MQLHSSHLNIRFIGMSSFRCVLLFQKPTKACVYPQVTKLCPKAGEETCWLTQLPDHAQNTCANSLFTSELQQQPQNLHFGLQFSLKICCHAMEVVEIPPVPEVYPVTRRCRSGRQSLPPKLDATLSDSHRCPPLANLLRFVYSLYNCNLKVPLFQQFFKHFSHAVYNLYALVKHILVFAPVRKKLQLNLFGKQFAIRYIYFFCIFKQKGSILLKEHCTLWSLCIQSLCIKSLCAALNVL